MKKDDLKFIYDTIIHQTDKTDTKAYFLLVLQVTIIGYFLVRIKDLEFSNVYATVLSVIITVLMILALTFMILSIWPGLSSKVPNSKNSIIYFHHILHSFKKDKKKLIEKFEKCELDDFNSDLIEQIISISHLVVKKYKYVQNAIIFLVLQIGFFIALFVLPYVYK